MAHFLGTSAELSWPLNFRASSQNQKLLMLRKFLTLSFMAKKSRKRVTTVHEHPRYVPISRKNPSGITIVDEHPRRLKGSSLSPEEINMIFAKYDRKGLVFPSSGKLGEYKNSDNYDELIAVWTDYFNKKFGASPPLDPDVMKALIASESGFRVDPAESKIALGIAQITKPTLEILQDPKGEAKDFVFTKIRQKDLKDPNIAIPLATRWLFRKKETARGKLGREPDAEELILEYKGLLKSKTSYKEKALGRFRREYELLKKK